MTHAGDSSKQLISATSDTLDIDKSTTMFTESTHHFDPQSLGEVPGATVLSGGQSIRESVADEVSHIQEVVGYSTEEIAKTSIQRTTETLMQWTTQTSSQQTVQASSRLEFGESTNRVTLPESVGQIDVQAGELDISTIPSGQSIPRSVIEESVLEPTKELGQSSTQQVTQTVELTHDAVVTLGEIHPEDYIHSPGILVSVGTEEHGVLESGGETVSSSVTEQMVTEAIQEKISVETATELAEVHATSSGEAVEDSTATEATIQLAVTESGREQSLELISSVVENVSGFTMQEAVQETTSEAVGIETKNFDPTFGVGETRLNIQSGEIMQCFIEEIESLTTGTSANLEVGESSSAFSQSVGHISVNTTFPSGEESISGEIVRESTQEHTIESSAQQTTHTSTQQTTQTSTQQQTTRASTQQTTQTSTQQVTQTSVELETRESADRMTFSRFANQHSDWVGGEIPDFIAIPSAQNIQEGITDEIVRDSTKETSQSSTQPTTQTWGLFNRAVTKLGSTLQDYARGTGRNDSEIQVSAAEQEHKEHAEENSSSLTGQTTTETTQEIASSSLEGIETATASAEVYDSSSTEILQTSTLYGLATEATTQLAVTESDHHGREQSLDEISSVQTSLSSVVQGPVPEVKMETIGIETTSFNVQSDTIITTAAENSSLDVTSIAAEERAIYSVTSEQESDARIVKEPIVSTETHRTETNATFALSQHIERNRKHLSSMVHYIPR